MNPELKAYLDELSARDVRYQRVFDEKMARINGGFDTTTAGDVTQLVTASSGTAELVHTSAGLAAPPATVPIIEESLAVAPTAPIDTTSVAPATCLTDCAAQAVTVSTISDKLASHNDDDERGAPLDNSSVDGVPFSVAPALSPTAGAHDAHPVLDVLRHCCVVSWGIHQDMASAGASASSRSAEIVPRCVAWLSTRS